MGHLGGRDLTGAEAARIEVDRRALGENGARLGAGNDDRHPPMALIDHRRHVGECGGKRLADAASLTSASANHCSGPAHCSARPSLAEERPGPGSSRPKRSRSAAASASPCPCGR